MKYSTPELVVLGPASVLVLGVVDFTGDSINPNSEHLAEGFVAGLDD
jgi:hypothetical protein